MSYRPDADRKSRNDAETLDASVAMLSHDEHLKLGHYDASKDACTHNNAGEVQPRHKPSHTNTTWTEQMQTEPGEVKQR
jgi:hypothetical protein